MESATVQMQVGDMMAFIQYTMQIIMGFLMLCMISVMLPRAAVAADRVDEVLKSETIIRDPERPEVLPEQEKEIFPLIMYPSNIREQTKMCCRISHLQPGRDRPRRLLEVQEVENQHWSI